MTKKNAINAALNARNICVYGIRKVMYIYTKKRKCNALLCVWAVFIQNFSTCEKNYVGKHHRDLMSLISETGRER